MVERPSRGFEPVHSAHAIEQVAFTIQLAQPIEDAQLDAADLALQGIPSLPKRQQFRTVMVALSPISTPPVDGAVGYLFQRFRADGSVEAEVRMDRNSVTFRTAFYTRWAQVWAEARSYLLKTFPMYLQSTRLAAIGLTYVDKFIWVGAPQEARAAALLRLDCPYVPAHIFRAEDFWHSHTGAFIKADAHTKRLMNVNVDCLDQPQGTGATARTVSITTVINDMFNQSGYDPLGEVPDPIAFVEDHLEALHAFDKSIIAAMLTPQMSRRIALEG